MKIQQILISIILVIILIIWYFKKNNNLEYFEIPSFICKSDEDKDTDCEITNLQGNKLISDIDTKFADKTYNSFNMNKHSMEIQHDDLIRVSNIGIYFNIKKDWVGGNIMTLKLASVPVRDGNELSVYFIIRNNGHLQIKTSYGIFKKEEIKIERTDNEYKFWLYIKLKQADSESLIEININNIYKIDIKKEDLFPEENPLVPINVIGYTLLNWKIHSFNGTVVGINAWNDNFDENICNHYSCKTNNINNTNKCIFNIEDEYIKTNESFKDSEKCIEKCMNYDNCNIIDCQKKCLECINENGLPFEKVDRDTYCPWIKTLIASPQAPESPKIRGFPDEKKINKKNIPIIVLEWRKPNSSSCKIDTYIIEIKELGIGSNGIKILNVPQLENDTFQKEIMNLKPQTTYKINVVALGKVNIKTNNEDEIINLISKKSNILTITTTGENNNILNKTYDYFENDNENLVSYVCDYETKNSDHILNNINNDEIDIYKSLKKL